MGSRGAAVQVSSPFLAAKLSHLAVVQPQTFELVIDPRAASMLGISVPPMLLAIAN
jgi:hypothetical protein